MSTLMALCFIDPNRLDGRYFLKSPGENESVGKRQD